ncbi:hypothetical protein EVAR_63415_1 [Eumeta japonica]|uniref:Uncharacterized protein n=1 Tax=Eumeta variegata TaxID=151549 RepID=A0A4C1Z0Q2_EUMVA|nr:hypothetical protein EVAR_63415_1 [Eumeta japonica]
MAYEDRAKLEPAVAAYPAGGPLHRCRPIVLRNRWHNGVGNKSRRACRLQSASLHNPPAAASKSHRSLRLGFDHRHTSRAHCYNSTTPGGRAVAVSASFCCGPAGNARARTGPCGRLFSPRRRSHNIRYTTNLISGTAKQLPAGYTAPRAPRPQHHRTLPPFPIYELPFDLQSIRLHRVRKRLTKFSLNSN